jgi:hypothetical protein
VKHMYMKFGGLPLPDPPQYLRGLPAPRAPRGGGCRLPNLPGGLHVHVQDSRCPGKRECQSHRTHPHDRKSDHMHLYPAVIKTIRPVVAKIVACLEDSTTQSSTATSTSTRPGSPIGPHVVVESEEEDALDRYLLASRGGSSDGQARFCRAVPSRLA